MEKITHVIKLLISRVKSFFVGERVKGEPIGEPKLNTTYPDEPMDFNAWCNKYSMSTCCRRSIYI